jgi:hypothetical protein
MLITLYYPPILRCAAEFSLSSRVCLLSQFTFLFHFQTKVYVREDWHQVDVEIEREKRKKNLCALFFSFFRDAYRVEIDKSEKLYGKECEYIHLDVRVDFYCKHRRWIYICKKKKQRERSRLGKCANLM